jgi:uncharacterized membrane protein YeaQ/YmgE (transglycosylase-associated protein family)
VDNLSLLLLFILGGIGGLIASYIMRSSHGIFMDMLLGIVGAFVGSLVMHILGQSGTYGFNLYSIFVAVMGSVIVIFVEKTFFQKRLFY